MGFKVMKCQKCGHVWPYTGDSDRRCICPSCGTTIRIDNRQITVAWDTQPMKLAKTKRADKGYFFIHVFNKKASVGLNVFSEDGSAVKIIYVLPRTLNIKDEEITRAVKEAGGKIDESGEYPINDKIRARLKALVGTDEPESGGKPAAPA